MSTVHSWLAAAIFTIAIGCAGRQPHGQISAPKEGVYAVISRSCGGSQEESQECARLRYIEVVRGKFYGVRDDELAIVEWMAQEATGPYVYQARQLRGSMRSAGRYMVDQVEDDQYTTQEWLVLDGDEPREYRYERSPLRSGTIEPLVSVQLAPVVRDAALAKRIPYPPRVEE